jgi:hypothetical protein
LLVYRENNLGHGSPRFQVKRSELRKLSEWLLFVADF